MFVGRKVRWPGLLHVHVSLVAYGAAICRHYRGFILSSLLRGSPGRSMALLFEAHVTVGVRRFLDGYTFIRILATCKAGWEGPFQEEMREAQVVLRGLVRYLSAVDLRWPGFARGTDVEVFCCALRLWEPPAHTEVCRQPPNFLRGCWRADASQQALGEWLARRPRYGLDPTAALARLNPGHASEALFQAFMVVLQSGNAAFLYSPGSPESEWLLAVNEADLTEPALLIAVNYKGFPIAICIRSADDDLPDFPDGARALEAFHALLFG